jgi:hypothetical protein
MSDLPSFDLDAAGLRADGRDLEAGVEVLAVKLESALPSECRVQRRSKGLFNRDKVVESIEVRLGEARYALRYHRGRVETSRDKEVRGVVIKREQIGLADWVAGLEGELREQAQTSAAARAALERLVE